MWKKCFAGPRTLSPPRCNRSSPTRNEVQRSISSAGSSSGGALGNPNSRAEVNRQPPQTQPHPQQNLEPPRRPQQPAYQSESPPRPGLSRPPRYNISRKNNRGQGIFGSNVHDSDSHSDSESSPRLKPARPRRKNKSENFMTSQLDDSSSDSA